MQLTASLVSFRRITPPVKPLPKLRFSMSKLSWQLSSTSCSSKRQAGKQSLREKPKEL